MSQSYLILIKNAAVSSAREKNVSELMELNDTLIQHGMTITLDEAKELVLKREKSLSENGRVEIGLGALGKIAQIFAGSRYIQRNDFAYEIEQIADLFYFIKTEIKDTVSDIKLINSLFYLYENKCGGSFSLLSGYYTDKIIRYYNTGHNINNGNSDIMELVFEDDYLIEEDD